MHYTDLRIIGLIVARQLRVIFEVIFRVEYESELRIGPSRQDFEIFEFMYTKNGYFGCFWGKIQAAQNFLNFFTNSIILYYPSSSKWALEWCRTMFLLKVLTNSELGFGFYAKNYFGNDPQLHSNNHNPIIRRSV